MCVARNLSRDLLVDVQPTECETPVDYNIYLGTPVGGGVVAHEYMQSIMRITEHFRKLGWKLTVVTQPDGLVTRSRNAFASVVVRDPSITHLLMLDADVAIDPAVLERMVRSGHDVVGAGVPLRQVDWQHVREHLDLVPNATAEELRSISHRFAIWFESNQAGHVPIDGFLPALVIGSAALLISRDALVTLTETDLVDSFDYGGAASDDERSGWTFFDPFVNEFRVYLSEDYAFCDRWRRAGGQVWVDLESSSTHVGPVPIEGEVGLSIKAAGQAAQIRRSAPQTEADQPE